MITRGIQPRELNLKREDKTLSHQMNQVDPFFLAELFAPSFFPMWKEKEER